MEKYVIKGVWESMIVKFLLIFSIFFLILFLKPSEANTITLNESNGGNVGDSVADISNPTFNYGTTTTLPFTGSLAGGRIFILWNLSVIPAGSTINNANMSLYMSKAPLISLNSQAYNTSLYNDTGAGPWFEGTVDTVDCDSRCDLTQNITYNNMPSLGTTQGGTVATGTTANVWKYWNVTNATITTFANTTNKNMSIEIYAGIGTKIAYFNSKENSDTAHRPQLVIDYTPGSDSTSPTYSKNTTNTTAAGRPCNFSLEANDNLALNPNGKYMFSTNNSGTWVNSSWTSFTSTPQNMTNVTTLNSTVGAIVAWCFYFNDSAGNLNATSCTNPFMLNTTDITPPTYSNLWQNVTNDTVVGPTIIGFGAQWNDNIGLSMFVNSSNISGWTNYTWVSFTTGNWSNFTMDTTGITAGAVFQFRIYANDTSNNQNATGVWQYTKDGTPPTYSSNSTNSTTAGTPILHSLNWSDNIGLSGYIFSFDNCTGSLTNGTWTSFSGTWSNVTKIINSTSSCTIRWCVYANDTSNNWNGTSCSNPFSYNTQAAVFISISISPALLDGIMFGTINPNTNDNPALNNTNGLGGGTAYNITIDSSTTVNVDLYNDASGNLVSGSYIIGIGNVTNQANTTSNTGSNLVAAGSIALSTAYSIIGSICQNLVANSNCWISYWLDSPTAQPPGSYTTTYKYCAVQNGTGSSQCG